MIYTIGAFESTIVLSNFWILPGVREDSHPQASKAALRELGPQPSAAHVKRL